MGAGASATSNTYRRNYSVDLRPPHSSSAATNHSLAKARAISRLHDATINSDADEVRSQLRSLAAAIAAEAEASSPSPPPLSPIGGGMLSPKASMAEKKAAHHSARKLKLERQATRTKEGLAEQINNFKGQGGLTLLQMAIVNSRADGTVVKMLIDAGADVTATDHTGGRAISWAASSGRSEAVLKLLLSSTPRPNVNAQVRTVLCTCTTLHWTFNPS